MTNYEYSPDDPIAALATGWDQSALAVIRVSGADTVKQVSSLFSRPAALEGAPGHSLVYGHIVEPPSRRPLEQVLVAVFRAPRSYTGEESLEISCHGGLPAVKSILDLLEQQGIRSAAPGEFTMRAFMNGKLDLTRAEAVHEIVTAKTQRAHELAFHRLSGALESRINRMKEALLDLNSAVEVILDYPEDELDGQIAAETPLDRGALSGVEEEIRDLLRTYDTGRIYRDGVAVALAGQTNAGKSSLFNLFLREDRAIVSEIHGTTRDYLESWVTIEGIPVRLFDTAGFRQADNPIESEGIRRSGQVIGQAALILYLVDASRGLDDEDRRFLAAPHREKVLPLWHKADIGTGPAPEGFFSVSSLTGEGFHGLEERIAQLVLGRERGQSELVLDSRRQKRLLERCLEALGHVKQGLAAGVPLDALAGDLREALNALGEITGEITSGDILDRMFSEFCVGK